MSERAFHVDRVDPEGDCAELRFSGRLSLRDGSLLWHEMHQLLERPAERVRFDLSALETLDGGSTALLLRLQSELTAQGRVVEISGAGDRVQAMLDLHRARPIPQELLEPPPRMGFVERVGSLALARLAGAREMLDFMGDLAVHGLAALRNPRSVRWRDLGGLMERAGADALPIVVLINFLVGLVMGFQAAVQLKQIGANIYVADLVALSVTRELGPLMTAIIVAGRTGAAYAAELASMTVSEEVDALKTLRLDAYRFLVLPRLVALVCVLPLLTLMADLVGVLGGLVVAIVGLDLTIPAYMIETRQALGPADVYSGMVKSAFFGGAIALISCQRGLATRGGAEDVGRATTSAVVTSLLVLIVLDAGFTVFFHVFDI